MDIKQAANPFTTNDVVMILSDNPKFHLMLGWVKETNGTVHTVEVESHSYPHRKKWNLRCLDADLVYVGTLDRGNYPNTIAVKETVYNDGHKIKQHEIVQHQYTTVEPATKVATAEPQLSHEECTKCGKMMMVRDGKCLKCMNCGDSSGGCS